VFQLSEMAQTVLHCPDCGSDRPFGQHHADAGGCQDSPDGHCPEWSCTACGTALLMGAVSYAGESAGLPSLRDRVA
jgi:hypothetical protein